MPITATTVTATRSREEQLACDKRHVVLLTVNGRGLNVTNPSAAFVVRPYAEPVPGSPVYADAKDEEHWSTRDLYAAIANMMSRGHTKMAVAMQAVFDAVQECTDDKYAIKALLTERRVDEAAKRAAAEAVVVPPPPVPPADPTAEEQAAYEAAAAEHAAASAARAAADAAHLTAKARADATERAWMDPADPLPA